MEIREYFKLIGKHLTLVIVLVILTGVGALVFSKYQPKTYTASTTFIVNKNSKLDQGNVSYYLFDNYYNVQSAGLFSQMVATWFESPSLAKEIYEQAGIPVPDIAQKKLPKLFRAIRFEPATINLSVGGKDPVVAEKLVNAAGVVLQQKTNELGKNDNAYYEIAKFSTITTENKSNLVLNTIIGLFSGLLISIIIALGIEYFRKS